MGNYEDLMDVVDPSAYDDSADTTTAQNATTALDKCASKARAILSSLESDYDPVITGALRSAVSAWVTDYIGRLSEHSTNLSTAKTHYDAARAAMKTAVQQGQALATDEQIEQECLRYSTAQKVTAADGSTVTGEAYAEALRQQYREERDNLAKEYLTTMNTTMEQEATNLLTPPPPSSGGGPGGAAGGGSGSYGAASAGLGASPGAVAAAMAPSVGALGASGSSSVDAAFPSSRSAFVGSVLPSPGAPGSRSNPFNDPEQLAHLDLLHTPINQRMTADGPVGGYIPPPVDNAFDPRWRNGLDASGGGNGVGTAIVGGLLGTGAAALARGSLGGLGGIVPAGGGVAGLTSQVPGSGLLSATTGGAGMYGPALASHAGMGTASPGSRGPNPAGTHGPARGPAAAAGASPAGTSEKKRRRRQQVGYEVLRLEDESFSEPVKGAWGGAGRAEGLRPIDTGEDDRW